MQRHDWRRVAAYVVEARQRLYGTQRQWATASKLSERVIYDLEKGERQSYRPSTLANVERSLHWLPGSISDLLEGGEPRLTAAAHPSMPVNQASKDEWYAVGDDLSDEERAAFLDLIRRLRGEE